MYDALGKRTHRVTLDWHSRTQTQRVTLNWCSRTQTRRVTSTSTREQGDHFYIKSDIEREENNESRQSERRKRKHYIGRMWGCVRDDVLLAITIWAHRLKMNSDTVWSLAWTQICILKIIGDGRKELINQRNLFLMSCRFCVLTLQRSTISTTHISSTITTNWEAIYVYVSSLLCEIEHTQV